MKKPMLSSSYVRNNKYTYIPNKTKNLQFQALNKLKNSNNFILLLLLYFYVKHVTKV